MGNVLDRPHYRLLRVLTCGDRATFSGSAMNFGSATFSGSAMNFGSATFFGGTVDFSGVDDFTVLPVFGFGPGAVSAGSHTIPAGSANPSGHTGGRG